LRDEPDRTWSIRVVQVTKYDASLVPLMLEMDLLTHSRPNFTRHTARTLVQHGLVFLLKADELVIGGCQCMRAWNNPNELILFNMAIRPGWRGHGLGSFFMRELLRQIEAHGVDSIVLEIDETYQVALRLYMGFGFEVEEHVEDEYGESRGYYRLRKPLFSDEATAASNHTEVEPASEKDAYDEPALPLTNDQVISVDTTLEGPASKG
jgi:ribosomal-protein-alanine N-acetyltransferase